MISQTRESQEPASPERPSAEQSPTPAVVTVKVLRQAVSENGELHMPGEAFETTAERAAALGNLVAIV